MVTAAPRGVGRPSAALRLGVWMHRSSLDAALAGGVLDSPQLSLRAQQILRPATRHRIADRLEAVVADHALSADAPERRVAIGLAHAEFGMADRRLADGV